MTGYGVKMMLHAKVAPELPQARQLWVHFCFLNAILIFTHNRERGCDQVFMDAEDILPI